MIKDVEQATKEFKDKLEKGENMIARPITMSDFKGWKPRINMASYSNVFLFAEVDIENREISFIVKKPNTPEARYRSDEMSAAIAQYNYWMKV